MERLTERNESGKAISKTLEFQYLIDRVAEYENAEEQGLLLRLPCKEGDIAWCVLEDSRYYNGGMYEVTVSCIEWEYGFNFKIEVDFKDDEQPCGYMRFHSSEFGERIFFGEKAKKEAEQALAEMQKG